MIDALVKQVQILPSALFEKKCFFFFTEFFGKVMAQRHCAVKVMSRPADIGRQHLELCPRAFKTQVEFREDLAHDSAVGFKKILSGSAGLTQEYACFSARQGNLYVEPRMGCAVEVFKLVKKGAHAVFVVVVECG